MGVLGKRGISAKAQEIPFKKTGILTTMSVHDIEKMIADHYGIRQNLIVPNVSWGFFNNHEADLVVVTPAGYLTEIEIKRSWPDFLADFGKREYHDDPRISAFYYAVPECMVEPCKEYLADTEREEGKIYPGVIGYRTLSEPRYRQVWVAWSPVVPYKAKKLSSDDMCQLSRLGTLRYWSLLDKLRAAEEKNTRITKDVALNNEVLRLKALLTEIKADYREATGESWKLEAY